MTRRAVIPAGLVVLALLLGGSWLLSRPAQQPTFRTAAPSGPLPGGVRPGTTRPTAPATPTSTPTTATATPPTTAPTATASPPPTPSASPTAKPGKTPEPYDLMRTTGGRGVALTFDDGPHPVWTPKVLDKLRSARVKATFCMVGTEVRQHPELVARIVREGHTLCNHSWHHEFDLGDRPESEIRANLTRTNTEIQRAVPGAKIPYYRQPGGKWTATIVSVAQGLGMTSLGWDVDPRDWDKAKPAEISKRVQEKARPGSIVLLHDGGGDRAATLAACAGVIDDLRRRYGIVALK